MAGVAGMNADVAGILEQMREQQRQQAEQHNALLAMMAQQQTSQIPFGPRGQRPRDPDTRAEERFGVSTLIPGLSAVLNSMASLRTGKTSSSSSGEPFALSQQLLTRK